MPDVSGLYAWYYRIELSDRDIKKCIEDVSKNQDDSERKKVVVDFFNERIFKYYIEAPYSVLISSMLKPTYEGTVYNKSSLSESLIEDVCKCPECLLDIKKALLLSVPNFASPIYIGLASNLRRRLKQHKALITKFQNANYRELFCDNVNEDYSKDHSFAKEVTVVRKLKIAHLVVSVMEYPKYKLKLSSIENLLNRINYPLCGRN